MAVAGIAAAFGLVVLAGLCAPLGACVVMLLQRSHRHLLSGCIALAAGVMIFVSLTEVLGESHEDLETGGLSGTVAQAVMYSGFFGGIILCFSLDMLTDSLLKLAAHINDKSQKNVSSPSPSGEIVDPSGETHNLGTQKGGLPASSTDGAPDEVSVDLELQEAADAMRTDDMQQLIRTSLLIGLALTLHNVPEGLATFVGYMSSPHLGLTIAIAIAVHNIPEGIAVGVPIFFATGSRWKAIAAAALTGLAEPIGALIGLAIQMSGQLNAMAMGIIMAIVAGIMTGVAFRELIPRALHYDASNKYASIGLFVGMAIMAASLVLLGLWEPAA